MQGLTPGWPGQTVCRYTPPSGVETSSELEIILHDRLSSLDIWNNEHFFLKSEFVKDLLVLYYLVIVLMSSADNAMSIFQISSTHHKEVP